MVFEPNSIEKCIAYCLLVIYMYKGGVPEIYGGWVGC